MNSSRARAAVVCSAGYPRELTERAAEIKTPLLILHGTADSPAEGGSEFTNVRMARDFEAALRRASKPVEAKYYEGAGHNGIFTDSTQHDDEVRRTATFLRDHLRR